MIEVLYHKIKQGNPVALFLVEHPENSVIDNLHKTKALRELINLYYFPIFKALLSYDFGEYRIEGENITFAYCSNEDRKEDFVNVCEYIGITSKCVAILLIHNNEVNIHITNEGGWKEHSFREVISLGRYSPRKIRSFLRLMGYENFTFEVVEQCDAHYGGWSRCVYVTHFIIPTLRDVTLRGEKFYDYSIKEKSNEYI